MLLAGFALAGCDAAHTKASRLDPAKQAVLEARGLDVKQAEAGLAVYEKNCLSCHGEAGKGQPGDWRVKRPNGMYPPPPLDDTAHAWHHPTTILRKAINEGSPPGVGDMPPWKNRLSEREIEDVIVYIKSLWSDEVYKHWLEVERQSQG